MSEDIQAIIENDLKVSTKKGAFSTPGEITNHVNLILDADYSTRRISQELQDLGWQQCGSNRARRKGKPEGFYYKKTTKRKALLVRNSKSNSSPEPEPQKSDDGESLANIDRRFKVARADKERALADTRKVETKTAKHKSEHLKLQLAKERYEYISISDVKRDWEVALNDLKIELYNLPAKYASRWASIDSESQIHDEFEAELFTLCRRLATKGEEAVNPDSEKVEKTNTEFDGNNI